MKKVLATLLVMVVLGLFGYRNSFATPSVKGGIKGDWVSFATVKGRYVGQSDQLKVYYDKSTLKVSSQFAYVKVWSEGSGVDYIMFSKQYGIWVYQAESNRVRTYRYRGGSQSALRGYQESSSNIPPERISKGTVMHLLLKTLKRTNPIIDFND